MVETAPTQAMQENGDVHESDESEWQPLKRVDCKECPMLTAQLVVNAFPEKSTADNHCRNSFVFFVDDTASFF